MLGVCGAAQFFREACHLTHIGVINDIGVVEMRPPTARRLGIYLFLYYLVNCERKTYFYGMLHSLYGQHIQKILYIRSFDRMDNRKSMEHDRKYIMLHFMIVLTPNMESEKKMHYFDEKKKASHVIYYMLWMILYGASCWCAHTLRRIVFSAHHVFRLT